MKRKIIQFLWREYSELRGSNWEAGVKIKHSSVPNFIQNHQVKCLLNLFYQTCLFFSSYFFGENRKFRITLQEIGDVTVDIIIWFVGDW